HAVRPPRVTGAQSEAAPNAWLTRAGGRCARRPPDGRTVTLERRFLNQADFRDRQVWLEEGELLVVPRGVEHRPVAEQEAHVLLFEPASTRNTGNVRNERTIAAPEWI